MAAVRAVGHAGILRAGQGWGRGGSINRGGLLSWRATTCVGVYYTRAGGIRAGRADTGAQRAGIVSWKPNCGGCGLGHRKGAPRRACRGVCRGCQDLAVVRSSLPCSSGVYRDPICGPKCNCAVENLDTNFLSPSATFIEAIISHCFNYKSTRCARLLLVSVAGLLELTRRKG